MSALIAKARTGPGPEHIVLGYHDVLAAGVASVGMSVSVDALLQQIEQVRDAGYTIVSLDQVVDAHERDRSELGEPDGKSSQGPLAAVTFDDALGGLRDHGLDALAEVNVSATVFVVADHLGVDPPWWPGMPATMTGADLGAWAQAGHLVGSHTLSHRSLPPLTDNELTVELSGSRIKLQEILQANGVEQSVDLLAYPSGHHNEWVRIAAELAGYRAAFTFLNGRISAADDPLRLPRITMGDHSTGLRFDYHLLRSADSWPNHQLSDVS